MPTGIHIPLRPDIYTDIAIGAVDSKELTNFKGTLSATGTATASLNVPANLPIPTGFKLYHAYVVYDGTTDQVFTSSNPVSVEFTEYSPDPAADRGQGSVPTAGNDIR